MIMGRDEKQQDVPRNICPVMSTVALVPAQQQGIVGANGPAVGLAPQHLLVPCIGESCAWEIQGKCIVPGFMMDIGKAVCGGRKPNIRSID